MCQFTSISSWNISTALYSNGLEAGSLCWQRGTSTHSTNLDRRHGTANPKIAIILLLHNSYAITALNILRWVLTRCQKYSSHNISSVGVVSTNATGHGRS